MRTALSKGGKPVKKLNLVFSVLLILVSVCFFFYSNTFKVLANQQDIGPSGFPKAVCVGLTLCGVLLFVTELHKGNDEPASLFNLHLLVGVAAILAFFFLLTPLGFILDGILICLVMMFLLLNEPIKKAWPIIVIVSVAAPLVLYFIFGKFLNVPLPMGILAPLLG